MAKMTPEQEAEYALDFGVARSDLSSDAQLAYDRLVEQRAAPSAPGVPAGAEVRGMVSPPPNWQYPQAPAPPYGAGTGAPPERPDSMTRAIALMWGGAGLSLVYYVVDAVVTNDWLTVQTTTTGTFHNTTYGGDIIPALVGIALWLWMIWKVREGRQWARVVSTVFFGFLCLEFLLVVTSGPGISRLLITTYFIFALLALVMLYQRESSAYFSAATLARSLLRASRIQGAHGQPGYGAPPQQYGAPPQQYVAPLQHDGAPPQLGDVQPPQ